MRQKRAIVFAAFIALLTNVGASQALGAGANESLDSKRSYVAIRGTGPALLYQPLAPNPATSHIAILIMHPDADFLNHITIVGAKGGRGLASLGYTILAENSTMSSDDLVDTDKLMLEVSKGVAYLRTLPGITKVVLLGHSGGGPTMATYQFIAENGVSACQGPERIVPCPNSLAGLPKADGLVLLDTSVGFAGITLTSLDPSVVDEKGTRHDPRLDLYNPANGFHPPTGGTYSPSFVHAYATGQARRMDALIAAALQRLKVINSGQGKYADDEPFDVPGASLGNGQLWSYDLALWSHTHAPHWLVKPSGQRVYQIVNSIREPYKTSASPVPKSSAGYLTTVKRFLSTWAVRPLPNYGYGADYIKGIDYKSSYNSVVTNVAQIRVPLLILGMSASQLVVSNETVYDSAASKDKSLIYIEGATHPTTPVDPKYGDTTGTTVSTLDAWLRQRY